jgi:hypothetical protein
MKIYRIIIILCIAFSIMQIGYAQESKVVILNLKKGYPVKGTIIEKTTNTIKIKSLDGDVFEYKTDEITSIVDSQFSSSSKSIFSEIKPVPQIYKKGDKILSLGIGSYGSRSSDETKILPFIPVSFEYILKDDLLDHKFALGVGGLGEYYGTKYSDWKTTILLIAARGYAHYSVIKKLDTYAGLSLGYYNVKVSLSNSDISGTAKGTMPIGYFIGCRYYFSKKFGGMAELGHGISWLTFGVAIKM